MDAEAEIRRDPGWGVGSRSGSRAREDLVGELARPQDAVVVRGEQHPGHSSFAFVARELLVDTERGMFTRVARDHGRRRGRDDERWALTLALRTIVAGDLGGTDGACRDVEGDHAAPVRQSFLFVASGGR